MEPFETLVKLDPLPTEFWPWLYYQFVNLVYVFFIVCIMVIILEALKKIGIERRVHTAGKNKSTLDPFLEEKNEDIERLKKIQLDLHKDFIDVVEKSRGNKLIKSETELFSGEFWSGSKAKNLGLVDGIGNAHEILKEKFGEDVIIKKFEKSKGWLSQKLSSSSNQVDQIANILDERSIWQRYGF